METPAKEQTTWTTLSLVEWAAEYLSNRGFDDARLNAELLLSHVLACKRIDLYLKFDRVLSAEELATFKALFKRRLSHEPLQYILGETEFMGLRLVVDKRVFIPRPDTEVLVEQVIRLASDNPSNAKRILDIGTGSGNIAISLAKSLQGCSVDSIDVSPDALDLAQVNVQNHQLQDRIILRQIDFLRESAQLLPESYGIIVSNPPYISQREFALVQPEVKEHEPAIACTDFGDGLTFYNAIAENGRRLLRQGGWVFVEVGYNQADDVEKIFREQGYTNIDSVLDYAKVKRVLKAQGS